MGFQCTPIERVKSISKRNFLDNYYYPQKPVVIEELTKDWPAIQKWNFDYLRDKAGNQQVPLYNNDPVDASKKVNEAIKTISLKEYLDVLEKEPTDLRIFLFNLIKRVPELKQDFEFPDLGFRLLKGIPMLFFGGWETHVFMHYDIDLANILHFHFHGKKRCMIIPPDQTKYMYKIPHSVICREDIDFNEPDFEKWPALANVRPLVADLEHGHTLFMPEGYWHYMKYLTPGFSMSLRGIPKRPKHLAEAVYNVLIMRNYDNLMRRMKGQSWIEEKNERAIAETHKKLNLV